MPNMTEQLSQAKVDAAIIKPMRARYQVPRGLDADYLIKSMYRDLAGFAEDVLAQAFDVVRREKPSRSWWPFPEEFEAAAKGIEAERAAGVTTDASGQRHVVSKRDAVRRLVNEFMASSAGQEACRDGWARTLVITIEESGQLPNKWDLDRMRGGKAKLELTLANLAVDLARTPDNPFLRSLIGMGQGILSQEARYARCFAGRAAPDDIADASGG